jgi:hypothetical protein
VATCGRCDSSTTITAKTIEARPRGPNQPRKATVWRRGVEQLAQLLVQDDQRLRVPSHEVTEGHAGHEGGYEARAA